MVKSVIAVGVLCIQRDLQMPRSREAANYNTYTYFHVLVTYARGL
jgi:hypothetical protein